MLLLAPPASDPLPLFWGADSSQQAVLTAASQGGDLVVIAPPGTGKIQTIANLIAHSLMIHQSVIVISANQAPLTALSHQLHELGVDSSGLSFPIAIGKINQQSATATLTAWKQQARPWLASQSRLDDWVAHLHHRYPNGLTPYQVIGHLLANQHHPQLVTFCWPSVQIHDQAELGELKGWVTRLGIHGQGVADWLATPLTLIQQVNWSPHWQRQLLAALDQFTSQTQEFLSQARAFRHVLGFPPDSRLDRAHREALATLARILPQAAGQDWRFALRGDGNNVTQRLREGEGLLQRRLEHLRGIAPPVAEQLLRQLKHGLGLLTRYHTVRQRLSTEYGEEVAQFDLTELQARWHKAERIPWLWRTWYRQVVQRILAGGIVGSQPADLEADLPRLITLQGIERELAALDPILAAVCPAWEGLATQRETMARWLTFQSLLPSALAGIPWDNRELELSPNQQDDLLLPDYPRLVALARLDRAIDALEDLGAVTGGLWAGRRTSLGELAAALSFQQQLSSTLAVLGVDGAIRSSLEKWLGYSNRLLEKGGLIAEAAQRYLAVLADYDIALETMADLAGTAVAALEQAEGEPICLVDRLQEIKPLAPRLHRWCSWCQVVQEANLRGLGPLVDALDRGRLTWEGLDETFILHYYRWWLDSLLEEDAVLRTFLGTDQDQRLEDFQRQDASFIALSRAYFRMVLAQHPANLRLMTTEALAEQEETCFVFDRAIFIGASQIPALVVGQVTARQHIVLGDPQSLPAAPPGTVNLLTASQEFPHYLLTWCYRPGELMAFSNRQYYQGQLVTFPSKGEPPITLYPIMDGYYDSATGSNLVEAQQLVAAVVAHCANSLSQQSLAILTATPGQQQLISTLLLAAQPTLGWTIPPPVMTLTDAAEMTWEEVMLSLTYSGEESDYGLFGEANGPYYLNMAITRPRRVLRIFSSLPPCAREDGKATQKSQGIRDLYQLLAFIAHPPAPPQYPQDAFTDHLIKALTRCHWQVDTSLCPLALAVLDPDQPGQYLAAVEWDGESYHRHHQARERDLLRRQWLQKLGWNVVSIWAMDWWHDPEGALDRLCTTLSYTAASTRPPSNTK